MTVSVAMCSFELRSDLASRTYLPTLSDVIGELQNYVSTAPGNLLLGYAAEDRPHLGPAESRTNPSAREASAAGWG
jgi:hypothetical protein